MRARFMSVLGSAVVGALLFCPTVVADDPITDTDDPALRPGGEGEATDPKVSPPGADAGAEVDAKAGAEVDANRDRRKRRPNDQQRRDQQRRQDRADSQEQSKPNQGDRAQRTKPDRADAQDRAHDATDKPSRDRADTARDAADRRRDNNRGRQNDRADAKAEASGSANADARFGYRVNENRGRLTLQNVDRNGAFARAGLRANDEIISVNGQRVSTRAELNRQLRTAANRQGGSEFTVFRNGRTQTIEANLSDQPDSLSDRRAVPPAPGSERQERGYRGAAQRPAQKATQRPAQKGGKGSSSQKAAQKATQKGSY